MPPVAHRLHLGIYDGAEFARELNTAREILSTPPNEPLKIGAGFLGWMLDAGGKPVDTLHVALKQRVRSIWLAFGNDLGKWVEYIRRYDLNRTQSHSTLIWILVSSVAEAQVATKEWKADVLVVQGRAHANVIFPFLKLVHFVNIRDRGRRAWS